MAGAGVCEWLEGGLVGLSQLIQVNADVIVLLLHLDPTFSRSSMNLHLHINVDS